MSARVWQRLKEEYEVDLEWRAYYLRADSPPGGMELPDYIKRARANGSEERLGSIANEYGMEFRSTERIYNTRLAHEATEYARLHGKGNEFHKVVFRMVYAEGKDPSNWDVEHLMTHPAVKRAVRRDALKVYGWVYRIDDGEILQFDPATYRYRPWP